MISTEVAGLVLRRLDPDDAEAYAALVQRNAAHLTRHGDFADAVAASVCDVRTELSDATSRNMPFAIELLGEMVGRVDLIAVDVPRYGLGYWVSEDASGRGLATAAVRAVLRYAAE